MKQIKVYDVFFPVWLLLFFPPIIIITLMGDFIIDSLVVLVCFFVFKLSNTQVDLKTFYKKSIIKVWLFGFLADFLGAVILYAIVLLGDFWGLPNKVTMGIYYDPFSSLLAVIIIISAMVVAVGFIFILNYKFTFNKLIEDKMLRCKLALTIALITMPWTFLVPTKLFYPGA